MVTHVGFTGETSPQLIYCHPKRDSTTHFQFPVLWCITKNTFNLEMCIHPWLKIIPNMCRNRSVGRRRELKSCDWCLHETLLTVLLTANRWQITGSSCARHVDKHRRVEDGWDGLPAVSLRSSTLGDRLDKDSQFLQTHVSSCAHPYDTDTQTITVWNTHTDRHRK